MSNTPALTAEYSKVIVGKFVTQRNGGPMHCAACGEVLVLGATFAATNGNGWTSYCATCAADPAALLTGLVRKLSAMGVTIDGAARQAVVDYSTALTPASFVTAKTALMNLRREVGAAQREAAQASAPDISSIPSGRYVVEGLDIKLDNVATGKWGGWVFVKTAAGDKVGSQRPGQRYSGKLADGLAQLAAELIEAAKPLTTTVPTGYYATTSATGNNDLDFWRVAVEGEGVKVQRVIGGHADTPVRRSTAVAALAAIEAAGIEAARMLFSTELDHCWACNKHLTDQVSRARGLGPDCADNLGF